MRAAAVPEGLTMRRTVLIVLFLALASASGCITPEDRKQWNNAVGDLRQDNIKDIAPLSSKR
jgi:hypothetical protein